MGRGISHKICAGVFGGERSEILTPRPCQSARFLSMLKLAANQRKSARELNNNNAGATKQNTTNKSRCANLLVRSLAL
jgi:hypothetical protein